LLDIARARESDVRAAAEAIVLPSAEQLEGDWRQRAFTRIAADLLTSSTRRELLPLMGDTAVFDAVDLLFSRLPPQPEPIRRLRSQVAGMMYTHAVSDYAVRLEHRRERKHNTKLFIANLVDMYLAAVGAEPGPESMSFVVSDTESARRATSAR
jgi:hypothetical protein